MSRADFDKKMKEEMAAKIPQLSKQEELEKENAELKAEVVKLKADWNQQAKFSNSEFLKIDAQLRTYKEKYEQG
jgi:hypothetical protein